MCTRSPAGLLAAPDRSPNRPKWVLAAAAIAAASLLAAAPASAGTSVLFDLEDQPLGTGLTSLVLTDPALTATLTRGGQAFDVVDLSALGGAVQFETRSLAASGDPGDEDDAPYTVDFSTPVSSFGVQFGDFADDDDDLSLVAYSGAAGSGSVVATDAVALPALGDAFNFTGLLVEGASIGSVVFIGGFGDNSTVVDNFAAVTVQDDGGGAVIPLPAGSLAAVPAGLVGLAAYRRARRGAVTG